MTDSGIRTVITAMAWLNRIWYSNILRFTTSYRLYNSLVIQAFKTKWLRKLLLTSYMEHKTNYFLGSAITTLVRC